MEKEELGTRKTRGVEKRRTRTVQKGSRRKERRKKRKIKNYEVVLSYGQLLFWSLCVDIVMTTKWATDQSAIRTNFHA